MIAMKEEAKLQLARIAADILIELVRSKSGHISKLRQDAGLSSGQTSLLDIYDVIYKHLRQSLDGEQ